MTEHNRYTLDGKQYSPDMELARERCPTCGTTHMVSYRVVEVTEQQAGGGFLWKTPENEGQLRIIMTSSMDNSGGQEAVAYTSPATISVGSRGASDPVNRSTLSQLYSNPVAELRRAPPPPPSRWATSPPVWVDELSPDAAEEVPDVQPEYIATPYNAPIGDPDETSIGMEDSVGGTNGSTISGSMDATVRDASVYLRRS